MVPSQGFSRGRHGPIETSPNLGSNIHLSIDIPFQFFNMWVSGNEKYFLYSQFHKDTSDDKPSTYHQHVVFQTNHCPTCSQNPCLSPDHDDLKVQHDLLQSSTQPARLGTPENPTATATAAATAAECSGKRHNCSNCSQKAAVAKCWRFGVVHGKAQGPMGQTWEIAHFVAVETVETRRFCLHPENAIVMMGFGILF